VKFLFQRKHFSQYLISFYVVTMILVALGELKLIPNIVKVTSASIFFAFLIYLVVEVISNTILNYRIHRSIHGASTNAG
jgi:hypothetical protein